MSLLRGGYRHRLKVCADRIKDIKVLFFLKHLLVMFNR